MADRAGTGRVAHAHGLDTGNAQAGHRSIKAAGQPSRAEGSHGMCCAKITRADGSPIVAGGRVTEEQQPPR